VASAHSSPRRSRPVIASARRRHTTGAVAPEGPERVGAPVSSEIDDLWAKVARGDPAIGLQGHQEAALLSRAEKAAKAENVADRLTGLKVADAVGGRDRLAVMACYLQDPDIAVRRNLFYLYI
jgi:hypothetical protein